MYEQASTIASDAIGNVRTVASFCVEEKIIESYRKKCEGPVKQGVRQGAISGLGYGFSFALLFCFYAVSFYVGARFVHDGAADVGQVFKVFFALTMMAVGVSQSSSLARDFSKVQDAAVSIFRIIDRKSKIDASSEEGTALGSVEGNIELQHVSFKYPARADVQIFKDLCLRIPSGKASAGGFMVAFAGRKYAARSAPIFVSNSSFTVSSFTLVLEFNKGRLQNLHWKKDGCGACSGKSNFVCLSKQTCAIRTQSCKTQGPVDCSIGIQLAFSGTDKHESVLNSWYEVSNLRQYSLYGLYSNLKDTLSGQFNKFF